MEELIGSLQTFEFAIDDRYEKKNKSISFISNSIDGEKQCNLDNDEGLSNVILLLGVQFYKVVRRVDIRSRSNFKNISPDINKNYDTQRKAGAEKEAIQSNGIQCYECECFGHTRVECPSYIKNQITGF